MCAALGGAAHPSAQESREAPDVPVLDVHVRRDGPSSILVELALSAPPAEAAPAARRIVWPAALPRACVRDLQITSADLEAREPIARALEAAARLEAEPSSAPWHLDLPARGDVRIAYRLDPRWPLPDPPASLRGTALLLGSESFLCAGAFPFGRLERGGRVRLRFDLGDLACSEPELDSAGLVASEELDDVLFAFGPWRSERIRGARLLLPARDLRLDAQGEPFREAWANALRITLERASVPLARALERHPIVVALPPPLQSGAHLLYHGGEELALGARVWRVPAATCEDAALLGRALHAALPVIRELAREDAALAGGFASAFALDALEPATRDRALRSELPCVPLRADVRARTSWAILDLLEREGPNLLEQVFLAIDESALGLGAAWREALAVRGSDALARFDALRSGAAIASSRALGGPWAVCEVAPLPMPGLYRCAGSERIPISALDELTSAESEAYRDLRARLALELAWPLARRVARWPAFDPESMAIDASGALRIEFGALYDAGAGFAGEIEPREAVRRLVAGGRSSSEPGTFSQRIAWRRGDLAAEIELEWIGVDPAPRGTELDPPIAIVRPRREGASLALRIHGLPPPRDAAESEELRWLFATALQAAPGVAGESEAEIAAPRTPRAGRAGSGIPGDETPRGYSGTPLAERAGFGFQRRDGAADTWRPCDFERAGHDALRHAGEAAVHERLVARFLEGLRWPLPRIDGFSPRLGGDDLPYRAGHDEGHDALDLGARLYAPGGREPLHFPAGTPVFPPHRDARRLAHAAAYPVLEVEVSEGDYRLRVRFDLVHVRPAEGWSSVDPRASLPPERAIGELQAFDASSPWGGWITTDPALRLRGASKGNHVHLACAGLFETRSPELRRNERKNECVRARVAPALLADYARAPLLQKEPVRASRSSASSPRVSSGAPGFHALFDGVEHESALARAGYDAEQQPLEHAAFAAAMRARLAAARALRDPETKQLRPIWSDGWLSLDESGALVQRVETPIEADGASYRLRLEIRYGGLEPSGVALGAVDLGAHFAQRDPKTSLGIELIGFDPAGAFARRIAALAADR